MNQAQFHFNGEVTLGTVFTIITIVASAVGLYWRLAGRIDRHADAINRHTSQLTSHDTMLTQILQDVARLIGWKEGHGVSVIAAADRRKVPRPMTPLEGDSPDGI